MSEAPGHDFTKVSHQDYATCNGCGAKIQFVNNPNAHKEMMEHECGEVIDEVLRQSLRKMGYPRP